MKGVLGIVQLRSFVAVADHGGFRRAASMLHLAQSAVSQHVRALERELGHRLVEREGRAFRFTPHGEALVDEARKVLAAHDSAMARLADGPEAVLSVACVDYVAAHVLPAFLADLRGLRPQLPVRVGAGRTLEIIERVAAGEVDVAFVVQAPWGRQTETVGTIALYWVSSSASAHSARRPLDIVTMTGPGYLRALVESTLADAGVEYVVSVEATTSQVLVDAVRAGMGVALMPVLGPLPPGLVVWDSLPVPEPFSLDVVSRPGLDPEIVAAAVRTSTTVLGAAADHNG